MTEKLKEKTDEGEDYRKVMQTIEEYIFQTHQFPSRAQVAEMTQITRVKCDAIIDKLIQENQLYSVFGGGKKRGIQEIILPYDMMQGVIMTQKRPDWLRNYSFQEKTEVDSRIHELNKEFVKYDMFERLLYRTDTPLEEAVAFTLLWLGFSNVEHYKDPNYADVTFENDRTKAIVEIEGTTKQGDKKKVLELEGWMKMEIEKGERDQSQIQGFFVVNHLRETDPETRGDPLTKHAKDFLNHYRFRFFTTYFLFKIVKQVKESKLSIEEARKLVWEGEKVK